MRQSLQGNRQVCILPVHTGVKLPLEHFFGAIAATGELAGMYLTCTHRCKITFMILLWCDVYN